MNMDAERSTPEQFAKIQALGNDFIWMLDPTDEINRDARLPWIPFLASDRVGIGSDGVIFWRPVSEISADLWFFNRDGSVASVCGNGLRAVAEAGCVLGYFNRRELALSMWGKIYPLEYHDDDHVWSVGLEVDDEAGDDTEKHDIESHLKQSGLQGSLVYMPNPHVVVIEDQPRPRVARESIVKDLNQRMAQGTNVGFYVPSGAGAGTLTVWERGVGWSTACGSGAAAALVVCILFGLADGTLHARQPGGLLIVERRYDGLIWITGQAALVFTGSIFLDSSNKLAQELSLMRRNSHNSMEV